MRRLPPLLRKAWFSLNQVFRLRIAALGITPDQYSILRWLHESPSGGMTQRELTEAMASDPNTIAATLRRMEAAGFLIRPPHQRDRRARLVQITSEGERLFFQARSVAQALEAEALGELPPGEIHHFLELLEGVGEACAKALAAQREQEPIPRSLPEP
jgi:DNA-binding MarR family transcriptional regulator